MRRSASLERHDSVLRRSLFFPLILGLFILFSSVLFAESRDAENNCTFSGVGKAYDVTSTSATLYFKQFPINPPIQQFHIEYGEAGFVAGTGVFLGVPGNDTIQINGLQPDKEYKVIWMGFCQGGIQSTSSETMTFRTPCAGVSPLPASATFDQYAAHEGGALDNCWHLKDEDGSGFMTAQSPFWETETGINNLLTGPSLGQGGQGTFIYLNTTQGFVGDEASVYSPVYDFTNQFEVDLTFYYHMFGGDMGDLFLDVNDGAGWINGIWSKSGGKQTSAAEPWIADTVDLSQFTGSPNVQLRFRGLKGGPASFMALDNIVLESTGDGLADFEPLEVEYQFPGDVIFNAYIPYDGRSTILDRGIAYSINPNPTIADDTVSNGLDTGRFNLILDNLIEETRYYVRPYAINGNGISYGSESEIFIYPYADVDSTSYNWVVNEASGITCAIDNGAGGLFVAGQNLTMPNGLVQPHGGLFEVYQNGSINPSWMPQIDGKRGTSGEYPGAIRKMEWKGSYLYFAGSLDTVDNQPRHGLGRYSMITGLLDPWAPDLDFPASVQDFALHQSSIFAIVVDTVSANHRDSRLVQIDRTTGAISQWSPSFSGASNLTSPYKLAIFKDHLIVGGYFQTVDGNSAPYLVAFDLNNNLQQSNWNSNVNGIVEDLLVVDDKLLVSGKFNQVNGQIVSGLMVFDDLTTTPSQINQSFDFSHGQSIVYGLTSHGRTIFCSTFLNQEYVVYRFPLSNINKVERAPEIQTVTGNNSYDQLVSKGDELLVVDRGTRISPNIHGGVITVIRPTTIYIDTEPIAQPIPDVALLQGEVLSEGGLGVSESGFVWGSSNQPDFTDNFEVVSAGMGVYSLELSAIADSLDYDTPYYARSFAIGSGDTTYGAEISFSLSPDPCKLAVEIPHLEPFNSWSSCWTPNADTSYTDDSLVAPLELTIEDNDHVRYRNTNATSPAQLPELISPIFNISEESELQFRWSHAIANPNASSNLLVSYQIEGSAIWDTAFYYSQMDNPSGFQYLPPQNGDFVLEEIALDTSLVGENVKFKFTLDFAESDFYLESVAISPVQSNCVVQDPPLNIDFNSIIPGLTDTLVNCVVLENGFQTADGINGFESQHTLVNLQQDQQVQSASIILPEVAFRMRQKAGRPFLEFDYHVSGSDFTELRVELSRGAQTDNSFWSTSVALPQGPMQRAHVDLTPFFLSGSQLPLQARIVGSSDGVDAQILIDNILLDDSTRYTPVIHTFIEEGVSANEALLHFETDNPYGIHVSDLGVCYSQQPLPDTSDMSVVAFTNNQTTENPYLARLTQLSPYSTYYARPFLVSDSGLIYGEELMIFTVDTSITQKLEIQFDNKPQAFIGDNSGGWFVGGYRDFQVVPNSLSHLIHINSAGQKTELVTELKRGQVNRSPQIMDLEVVGDKLYIAGQFDTINGVAVNNIARMDIPSGQIDQWSPSIVEAEVIENIVADSNSVFALFRDSTQFRDPLTLAEIDVASASSLPWRASFDQDDANKPEGLILFQNHVVVFGAFWGIPGNGRYGLKAYDRGNNLQEANWTPYSNVQNGPGLSIYDAAVYEDSLLILGGYAGTDTSAMAMNDEINVAVFDGIGGMPISTRSSFGTGLPIVKYLELVGTDVVICEESRESNPITHYKTQNFLSIPLSDLNSSQTLYEVNVATYTSDQRAMISSGCELGVFTFKPAVSGFYSQSLTVFGPSDIVFDPVWEWNPSTDTSIHPSTALLSNGVLGLQEFGFCISTQPSPEVTDTTWQGSDQLIIENEFTGLEPNTDYYVRAYAVNCEGVFYSAQTQFTTEPDCSPVELPYAADFEDDEDLLCWKLSDQMAIERKNDCPAQGNAAMNIWGQPFTYLESPLIDIQGLSGIRVSFDYWDAIGQCGDDAEAGDKLVFGWVDTNNTFNILATYEGDVAPNVPTPASFDLPVNYEGDLIFRFEIFGGDGMMTDNWMIDNFLVEKIDLCHLVGQTGVVGHIGNTAMVYFDPLVSQTDYVLEYGQQGFLEGTGVVIGSTKDTVLIPNLAGGETLDVYWSAICPNGDTTNSVLQSFTTPCDVLSLPYTESFDNTPVNCWSLDEGDAEVPQSDNDYIYGHYWNWAQGQKGIARSPRLDISGPATVSFKWAHKHMQAWPDDSLVLEARVEGDANWTALTILEGENFDSPNANNNTAPNDTDFVQETVALPAVFENEIVEFRFVFISGYGPNVYVDDFSVDLDPVCALPIDSITELNVNNGIYRAHFDTIAGDVLRLQFKGVNEANWRSRPIWRGDIGSQRFNLTPSFGTDVAVRIAVQTGGVWEYGCPDTISVPCRNQVLSIAIQDEAFCSEDSVLLRAGYAGGQGAPTFTWSNGSNAKRIFAQQGESVFVTVTDMAGCSISDTITAPALDVTGAPTDFSLAKLNATTFRGSWNAPSLTPGMNLIAYRMAYRLRGTTVWTITPFINDTFHVVDFIGSGLPLGNYEFTVFSRFNNGVRNTSSEFACSVVRGYNGSGNKQNSNSGNSYELSLDVKVYPNPTNAILYINGPEGALVQLLDMKGSIVRNANIHQAEVSLDLIDLAQGVYALRILHDDSTYNERIVKN